jgi:hypothetical protein
MTNHSELTRISSLILNSKSEMRELRDDSVEDRLFALEEAILSIKKGMEEKENSQASKFFNFVFFK